jgi:asparagine synthase (glutamine-hydrolysing)
LKPSFAALAEVPAVATPFPDTLRNIQYRDVVQSKIPRALRFNDRISMASSTELREPFLDHRLFELALRQPQDRKIRDDQGKRMLREIAADVLPDSMGAAAKRPVQTPQREWLRGPLRDWADSWIELAIAKHPGWLDGYDTRAAWYAYASGQGDNSFWVWQLVMLGML